MKKTFVLIAILCSAIASYAQTVSGTVLNTAGAPMQNNPVYVITDSASGYNSSTHGPGITLSGYTDMSGNYSFSIPSTTLSGHPLVVGTAECKTLPYIGSYLSNSYTYSGVNITSNFTTCLPTSIRGTVTLGSTGMPAVGAKVLLITKKLVWVTVGSSTVTSWQLSAVDSMITNSNGIYTFSPPYTNTDSVMVKAFLLPSHSSYSSYLPTYGANATMWSSAKCFWSNYWSNYSSYVSVTNNIALQAGINPGGPGFVGGAVILGANKTTAVGDPIPNRLIILTDGADKPVAYTYSDNNGRFSFAGVPYGSYKIFGDVGGKTSTPLSFTLNTTHPTAQFITFEEKALTFNASMPPLGVTNAVGSQCGIYPNPAKNTITITGLTETATVTIYDMTGRTLIAQSVNADNNTVNIASLATGNYVVKLATAQEATTMKLTKE